MFKKLTIFFIAGMGVVAAAAFAAAPTLINGAGATFPYPIYSKWFDVYAGQNPDLHFNYQSIGSGGGIKQIQSRTVDFGATDGPMTDQQLAEAPGRLFHIPMVMGSVAVAYNLPGVDKGLKLTPDVIADIFLGKITKWSDPRIASANPGAQIPDMPIVVAHRSDGSGTTFIFVDYLSAVSGEWKLKIGKGTSVNWPVGLGGKGNEGVAGIISQTPGALGYTELAYAVKNKLSYAFLENKSGNFVEPTIQSTSKAAEGVSIHSDFRVSVVNSSNPDAYPVAGFTWLLIYKNQDDPVKGKALVDFITWAIHDGQKYTADLLYAPLPTDVVTMIEKKLTEVKV
jgi:phosphate transport system substrate-binding protein